MNEIPPTSGLTNEETDDPTNMNDQNKAAPLDIIKQEFRDMSRMAYRLLDQVIFESGKAEKEGNLQEALLFQRYEFRLKAFLKHE